MSNMQPSLAFAGVFGQCPACADRQPGGTGHEGIPVLLRILHVSGGRSLFRAYQGV